LSRTCDIHSCQLPVDTIANATKVTPNLKARIPSYLLSLTLSTSLHAEHQNLHKKPHYISSAQLISQHTVADLEGANLLALINFPRKQIGSKMSDCLVTGVLPVGVDPEVKRSNTVFVRPWIPEAVPEGLKGVEPGAEVGVIPGNNKLVETNPRDLTWDEFMKVHIYVGKVEAIHGSTRSARDATLREVRLDVNFGDEVGKKLALLWLQQPFLDVEQLLGRQILAVTNLAVEPGSVTANWFENGTAAILTVNGKTVLEPAKEVEIGYRLA
jgi:hypothetical protein